MLSRRAGAYAEDEEEDAVSHGERSAASRAHDDESSEGTTATGTDAEEEEVDEEDRSYRARLERFLEASIYGHALEFFNCFMSTMACFLYVLDTYMSFTWLQLLELSMTCFFAVDYVVRLLAARRRLAHAMGIHAVVDFVTVVPSFVVYGQDEEAHLHVRVISFLRVLRILRITRITKMLPKYVESEVRQKMFAISLSVVSLVFVSAGLIHLVENMEHLWPDGTEPYPDGLPFHDVLYLITMTITTVGYGDISPKTLPGRGVILLMMVTALVLVPRQTNELIAIMAMSSTYARDRYRQNSPHVLVCGALNTTGVTALFSELFHPDHGQVDLYAVAMGRGLPHALMYRALTHPTYGFFIKYLDGVVMSGKDLARAAAVQARAVFIVSNQLSSDPEQDDAGTILRAMAVRRYVMRESSSANLLTCVQLIRPESKKIFQSSTQRADASRTSDQIVCTHELKMSFIAKSCTCPGVTTLLYNLIASVSDEETASGPLDWINEYNQGRGFEVYRVPLSPNFSGLTFLKAAEIVYQEAGCLLFALEVQPQRRKPRVVLNPGRFVLPGASKGCTLYAFVIAGDRAEAHVVSAISEADVDANAGDEERVRDRAPRRSSAILDALRDRRARRSTTNEGAGAAGAARNSMKKASVMASLAQARASDAAAPPPGAGPGAMLPGGVLAGSVKPMPVPGTTAAQALLQHRYSGSNKMRSGGVQLMGAGPNANRTRRMSRMGGPGGGGDGRPGSPGLVELHRMGSDRSDGGGGTFGGRLSVASSGSEGSSSDGRRLTALDFKWLHDDDASGSEDGDGGSPRTGGGKRRTLPGHAVRILRRSSRRLTQLAGSPAHDGAGGGGGGGDPQVEHYYHMRSKPVVLRDVTFSTVHDIRPGFGNHILLLGPIQDLYHFVLPLRSKTHNVVHPLVILAPQPPMPHQWKKISRFRDVSYVQGNPLDPYDLQRAGIHDAAAAVIFAKAGEGMDVSDGTLADADAIFTAKILHALSPGLFVMSEFVSPDSLNYLVPVDADEDEVENVFAAGSVYMASMLDTLVCQSFYNPHIITVVRQLVAADPRVQQRWNARVDHTDKSEIGAMFDSHLWQVAVPEEFHCKTYGELFTFLVGDMGMLPIGIRRGGSDEDGREGRMGNRMPYVFTNPVDSDPVFVEDTVFVLSQQPPADEFAGRPGAITVNDVMFDMWEEMNEDVAVMNHAVAVLNKKIERVAAARGLSLE